MEDLILVTGGAGFIGGCFIRRWLRYETGRVVNLDKLTYAASLEALVSLANDDRYLFVEGDVNDAALLHDLFTTYRPRAVCHFAAETHVDRSIDGCRQFALTNVVGTSQLLEASQNYWSGLDSVNRSRFRFLHVSTDEIYGSAPQGHAFGEQSRFAPSSPYAASKASATHFVQAFHATFGLPTLQTMSSNNYGPYQFPEKLIPLMTLNAVEGKPLPIYGNGKQQRDWLHVDDHCDALSLVLRHGIPGDVFNIASGQLLANIDVVHHICAIVDRLLPHLPHVPTASLIKFVTDRPGHDTCYRVDTSKIWGQLGWRPRHIFVEGLEETVRWYIENDAWVRGVTQRYARDRLGLATQRHK